MLAVVFFFFLDSIIKRGRRTQIRIRLPFSKILTYSSLSSIHHENDHIIIVINRPGDSYIELQINKWQYKPNSADNDKLTNISFSGVPGTISEETPITFGFTLQYVNGTDAQDGNDYWVFSPSAGSQITFDPHRDANVITTLNFSDFTNETIYNAVPEGLLTTISITKAGIIPEPSAFAAAVGLGVLGLAAVRRRRR